ncbi:MAG: sulfatase-like hydrolase/transferase [Sedimentisphaerales bacterium]|nr:sulfatase-like hydrolase/transferase [Sedimentisphaerales bacterium]
MNRRIFLKTLGSGTLGLICSGCIAKKSQVRSDGSLSIKPSTSSEGSSAKPNFVLVVADDLGYGDIGCYGHQSNKTPHLDTMAAEGMKFIDFHSNGPMCSPTRAALLTGQYQNRFGRAFESALSAKAHADMGLPLKAVTIPEALKKNGYATGMFGKWHLGYNLPYLPTRHGFDEFRGLLTGDGDHHSHISRSGAEDWYHNERIEMEDGYSVDLITQHSIDFIERNINRPFFLYVAHLAIHFPWQGPDEQAHRVKGQDYWNLSKLGPHKEGEVGPVVRRMVEAVDQSVGKIMAALKRLGLDNDTFVFFTSDNGGYLEYAGKYKDEISSNGPLRGQKGDVFEGGHRVPAIARWPGRIKAGSVTQETTMTMDLMPTYLELARAKTPGPNNYNTLDGRTLAPILFEGLAMPERALFWRRGKEWAVRRGPWKLVGSAKSEMMLFNLDDDIEEQKDLIKERPDLVEELLAIYTEWEKDITGKK